MYRPSYYKTSQLQTNSVLECTEEKRLRLCGHLKRIDENMLVKIIWETNEQKNRGGGRLSENWDTTVTRLILKWGKTVPEASALAKDKNKWSKFVNPK